MTVIGVRPWATVAEKLNVVLPVAAEVMTTEAVVGTTVTPVGKPVGVMTTVPTKPFCGMMETPMGITVVPFGSREIGAANVDAGVVDIK